MRTIIYLKGKREGCVAKLDNLVVWVSTFSWPHKENKTEIGMYAIKHFENKFI